MGRRLGEYTRNNTKCMVEVNGQKLIDRLLLQLQKLNFSRIIIVVGYKGKELQASPPKERRLTLLKTPSMTRRITSTRCHW